MTATGQPKRKYRPGSGNAVATRYVTKHALSPKRGIELIHGVLSTGGYFHYQNKDDLGFETSVPPGYHFDTFEEALANAKMQRKRKIENLKKQIRRVERLDWAEPGDVKVPVLR